jgi:PAS domain S-box-containing protein
MPTIWLLSLALGVLAAGAGVLFVQRRSLLRALDTLGEQLTHIVGQDRLEDRVTVPNGKAGVTTASDAVNQLLSKLAARGQKLQERELVFQRLVESVHEAVVLHRDTILFTNARFAALTGLAPRELIGRRLHELVPGDYAELVRENIRRRLAGEAAAERYEIELVGAQGQVSRLEIAAVLVDVPEEPMLLITAVEMTPRRGGTAPDQER